MLRPYTIPLFVSLRYVRCFALEALSTQSVAYLAKQPLLLLPGGFIPQSSGEVAQEALLLVTHIGRYLHVGLHDHVAPAAAAQVGHALSLDTEALAVLCSGGYLEGGLAPVNGGTSSSAPRAACAMFRLHWRMMSFP